MSTHVNDRIGSLSNQAALKEKDNSPAVNLDVPPADTRYELPASGITLLGYVVRRMHKTSLLLPVAGLLKDDRSAEALAQIALYAAAASASFGPAYYQPASNTVGETAREADPETQAAVAATLDALSPQLRISSSADLPDGGRFSGIEAITGTTVGLHGLGMPAPSQFSFTAAGGYAARLSGTITSELMPRLFAAARIRAHGTLRLSDDRGNAGSLTLTRDGHVHIDVTPPGGPAIQRQAELAPSSR